MDEEEITDPILISRRDSGGWRFYKCLPAVYLQLAGYVDATRGIPKDIESAAPTLHGLKPIDRLQVANDASGFVLVQLESARFSADDDDAMKPFSNAGALVEMTKADFEALKPEEKPI